MEYNKELTHENIMAAFGEAGDFNYRPLVCRGVRLHTYGIDGITSGDAISEYVFRPLLHSLRGETAQQLYEQALYAVVENSVAKPCGDLQAVLNCIVNGFCVVLFPGAGAIAFETKTGEKRSPSAPDLEHTAKGPKDAFVETVRSNTSLVRRHLRTAQLRIYETQVGRRSLTNVSVLWVDGLTDPTLVDRMKQRLAQIDIDGMLFPAAVEEYVTGSRATPFPLLQYTQRTDRFCQGLLQGRVALLVDGLPVGYLAPVDIGYLMNSPEDLGRDYISASWVRILRYGALLVSLLFSAMYVAFTVYHRQWIPDMLLQIISESRDHLPYSSAWEVLALLAVFELLQESGVHLPQNIGQSVSIVGGIVVGTTAAEAGLISPMALIVVSLVCVCGFVIPNRDFAAAIRVCRFGLAALASVFGLTGILLGVLVLLVHLCSLKSMGISYIAAFEPGVLQRRLIKNKWRNKRLSPLDRRNQK